MERGEIRIKNETVARYENYLVSRGIPLPPGKVREPESVSIRDEERRLLPCYYKVLQRRSDGSIEWLLMDLLVDLEPEEEKVLHIGLEASATESMSLPANVIEDVRTVSQPVRVSEDAGSIRLTNAITDLTISKTGGAVIRRLTMYGKELVGAGDLVDLQTVDLEGKVYRASVSPSFNVTVEHRNPVRATVKVEGKHTARDGSTFLDFALRITLSANRPDLEITHTFYCREPRRGPVEVRAIRFVMPTRMGPAARKLVRQAHHGHSWFPRPLEIKENVEIVASSVNDINNYPRDYKPYQMGQLFLRNFSSLDEDLSKYPFYMHPEGGPAFRANYSTGGVRQIYPYVGWQQPDMTLVFGMRHWRQLHPKSVQIDENVLTVSLWPDWATPLKLLMGVSRSHTFWLAAEPRRLDVDACERKALQWEVQGVAPLAITINPGWVAHCKVVDCQHLLAYQPEKYAKLENKISATPGEPSRFTYARNAPTGMLNFGDAGGEAGFTNNEDDVRVFVPLRDYLRTGRSHHFDYGLENALHYMEVDFCEWSTDPRQSGGLIPHTVDHFFGNVYPSHQWAEGILAYYYLTGDERAKNVVIRVGDNQIYWVNNLIDQVCCDGRESGMPLVNLAAAYRLTRDEKYLHAAHQVIDNFHRKWFEKWGDLKYPYPQGAHLLWITGYGDWSSYYGLYRIWEVSGDESVKELLVKLLASMMDPARFGVDDSRAMDFMAVWIYLHLTGDHCVLDRLKDPIENFLLKGGHPMRRLEFLKILDEEGLINP